MNTQIKLQTEISSFPSSKSLRIVVFVFAPIFLTHTPYYTLILIVICISYFYNQWNTSLVIYVHSIQLIIPIHRIVRSILVYFPAPSSPSTPPSFSLPHFIFFLSYPLRAHTRHAWLSASRPL